MWVLFSERANQFSRLVSLNLENGKQTCIATASAGIPIIAAYEASARRLAYIHDAGGDANVVWYRLPSLEPERFGGLWNGRPVRIALSLCGRRAALESILPTGVTAIYVFELPETSGAAELMAGITLGEGVSLKRPLFLDGRDRIFCFVQGEGGGVSTALIDLSHIGEATHTAPGARRAARSATSSSASATGGSTRWKTLGGGVRWQPCSGRRTRPWPVDASTPRRGDASTCRRVDTSTRPSIDASKRRSIEASTRQRVDASTHRIREFELKVWICLSCFTVSKTARLQQMQPKITS